MRESYRKPIASKEKFPQFITMNVIDGQAGLVRYSSLIFYSLTINNILNIIILVILAAVSVRAVYEMGIVNHAVNGTRKYAQEAVKENQMLDSTGALIEDTIGKLGQIQGTTPTSEGGTILAALKDGTIKVGDYINYQAPSVSATYNSGTTGAMTYNETTDETEEYGNQEFSVTTDDSNKMGWRVLGYGNSQGELTLDPDEATNVLLIAANPIQKYLVLGKEQAYLNGPSIMNDLSSKFGTSGINAAINFTTSQTTARSVNIEDLNTAFGITVDRENGVVKRNNETIEDSYAASGTYNYTSTDWEMGTSSVSYGTGLGKSVTLDGYNYTISATDVIGHMLLDGTTETDSFDRSYWFASRGVDDELGFANFGPGYILNGVNNSRDYAFASSGSWYSCKFGVRPVVSLASGLQYGTGSGQLSKLETAPTGWSTLDEIGEVTDGQYTAPSGK